MRVVIVEDSGLLRDALTRLLSDFDIEVVAAVPTAEGLRRAAEEHAPDVFVVDVRLPPTFTDEGVRAAADLRTRDPEAKALLLSQAVEERYARDLLAQRSEGFGYLLKDRVADGAEFVDALRRVAANGTRSTRRSSGSCSSPARDDLSPRERQVLEAMAEAARTRPSPAASSSPIARSKSTSPASSGSSGCPRARRTTAACSPSSPGSGS